MAINFEKYRKIKNKLDCLHKKIDNIEESENHFNSYSLNVQRIFDLMDRLSNGLRAQTITQQVARK